MLCRVAEHVLWMGRYVERVLAVGRLIEVSEHLELADLEDDPAHASRCRHVARGQRPRLEHLERVHGSGPTEDLLGAAPFGVGPQLPRPPVVGQHHVAPQHPGGSGDEDLHLAGEKRWVHGRDRLAIAEGSLF